MSLFCIIGFDQIGSTKEREQHREKHLEYLKSLNQQKRLFAAGPLMSSEEPNAVACGSMLIVNFENIKAAEKWMANEPYYRAGVYQEIQIKPYLDAMPNCDPTSKNI